MYLQLAESPYNRLAQQAPNELYIFVPQGFKGSSKDMYIREDKFDDLPESEYRQLMFELAPYQPQGLSGKADRKQRREDRRAKKATKGGGARREARQKRVDARMKAKVDKAAARGGGAGGIFDKVIGAATNIFGKGEAEPMDRDFSITGSPGEFDVSINNADGEESFFQKNKIPLLIGGAVLVAGGIYLATKKK
jgi:hypothetical protein